MKELIVVLVVVGASCISCESSTSEEVAGGEQIQVVDMAGSSSVPDLRFRSVDGESIDTSMNVLTASVGDVNGDGSPDLLVPAVPPKVMINLGGTGFSELQLLDEDESLDFYTSSGIHDVNGDGRPDVLIAGIGKLQVLLQVDSGWQLSQQIDLPGNSLPAAFVIAPDYNDDGYPDHIFVVGNEWPQVGTSLFSLGALSDAKGPATLLKAGAEGLAVIALEEVMTEAMTDCINGPSWTGVHIPRRALGLHDLLYIGNVKTYDCLLAYDPVSERYTGALGGSHSDDEQGMLYATMGADFWYDATTVNLASSDFYESAIHLTEIPENGSACTQFEGTYQIPDGSAMEVGWGVIADRDLVMVARGDLEFEEEMQTAYMTSMGSYTSPGGLNLYEPDDDGRHVLRFEHLEDELEGLPFFHLAAGDFYGADGGDGCLDILATSTFPFLDEENVAGAIQDARLLVGQCDREFLGVEFKAIPGHVGSIVKVEFNTGVSYFAAAKGNAGVGGTRDPRVRVPLMGAETSVTRIEVTFPNGDVWSRNTPPLNEYLNLDGPEWSVESSLSPLSDFESPDTTECPPPY